MTERLSASKNPVIAALVFVVVIAVVAYRAWQRHSAPRAAPRPPATARP